MRRAETAVHPPDTQRQARFEELYAANFERLTGYVRRRTDSAHDAADVIAETFLTAWRRLDDVPPGEESRLWLYGVARRTLANHRRPRLGRRELMTRDLDALVRGLAPVSDAEAVLPVRDDTRAELARQITALPLEPAAPVKRRSRHRRWRIVLPLAAGLTAAAVAVVLLNKRDRFEPEQVAALSFTQKGQYIEVRINDPLADPKRYEREFAAHDMKIRLYVNPVSPSLVGKITYQEGPDGNDPRKIETIPSGRCVTGGGGDGPCLVGLRIPVGYRNEAGFAFGRAARPGERYDTTNSSFGPGEALHCFDVRGLTVDEAAVKIQQRKVTATEFHYDEVRDGTTYGVSVGRNKIPGDWYVTDVNPVAPGLVSFSAQANKPVIQNSEMDRALFKGC